MTSLTRGTGFRRTGVRRTGFRGQGGGWRWGFPALLLLTPFLLWPVAAMLWRGIAPQGSLSASVIVDVAGDRFYWGRLGFTTFQALASTALSLAAGIPAAYVFARIRFPGRELARALVTAPFVLPALVVALAFSQLLGPSGWVNDLLDAVGLGPLQALGTLWLILLAHAFYNVSVVIRLVSGVWANLDPRTEEAAQLLGAGRFATFTRVTLPALFPAIASASALVFTFSFTSFGVILVLGAGGRFLGGPLDTVEVSIYRLATRLVELPAASVLALVQLGTTLSALTLYSALQRRTATAIELGADRARPLRETSTAERVLLGAVALVLGLLIIAPLAALVVGALTTGGGGALTAANFARLFEDTGRISYVDPVQAVRWSLTFALGATLGAAVVGMAAATAISRTKGPLGPLVDGALMLPLAVPAVVLGFGYLTTFNRGWYDLRGSPWLMLAAHSLIAYPFVLRAVLAVLRGIDPRLPEAARVLGATPWRVWRFVELPIATRALLAGSVFAFAISLGEFGATLLLRRREFATMPIAIFEALGRPGEINLGRALAMATVLLVVTGLSFLAIERFRYGEVAPF
ncbi:MAG: iron ABC transporter permease [Dehalococcoidia bacterium]|nr:iron ABC transporter permease [Dehalococcoidia bacterium]